MAWVPVDACALSTAELPGRLREFDDVFTQALRSMERRAPEWLRLRFASSPDMAERLRDLTAREAACCEFFEFEIGTGPAELVLDVRVSPKLVEVLTGMEDQARSAICAREEGSADAVR